MSKFSLQVQTWWCEPIVVALGRLRQKDRHEFEAGLVYIVSSRSIRATWLRSCLERKKCFLAKPNEITVNAVHSVGRKPLNKDTELGGQGRNGYLVSNGSAHSFFFFFFSSVKIVFWFCGELSVVTIQFGWGRCKRSFRQLSINICFQL